MEYDMDERLEFSKNSELLVPELLRRGLIPLLCKIKVKTFSYQLNRDMQQRGIDGEVRVDHITYDVKVRDNKFYKCSNGIVDFCIETVSVDLKNIPGWFYTSEATVVIYLWYGDDTRTNFINGYILKLPELRVFLTKDKIERYPKKYTNNNGYRTIWHPVPLSAIKEFTIPICQDYNQFLSDFFIKEENPFEKKGMK